MTTVISLVKLVNGVTVYTFNFYNFKSWGYDFNVPIVGTPIPQEKADHQILLKLEGNSNTIKFSWILKTTADNQETTANVNTKTYLQVISFFRDHMVSSRLEDRYKLYIGVDDDLLTIDGTLTNVKFNATDQAPVSVTGSFDFIEGDVVGSIYDLDNSSPAQNISLVKTANGTFKLDWLNPVKAVDIDFWEVAWQPANGAWSSDSSILGTLHTFTKSGLTNGVVYKVKIRTISGLVGTGKWSPEFSVTV